MAADEPNPVITADPLRLTRCPDCGYRLDGLPAAGRCPECGFEYSPDQVVLLGWAGRSKASVANVTGAKVWFQLICVLVAIFFFAHILWWLPSVIAVKQAVILLWLIAVTAVRLYRRQQLLADSPLPVHVRLFPEGFAQRDGFGPVTLHPWAVDASVDLEPCAQTQYRLQIRRGVYAQKFPVHIWHVVDLVFACDPATAQRLAKHISRCRQQASGIQSAQS